MYRISAAIYRIKGNTLFRLYKHYVIDSILIARRSGLRELVRQRGKKFFLLVFGYYLVRDTVVYIITLCIARGLF